MCRVSDNDNCIHQRIRCFVFRRERQRSRWNNLFLMLNSLFATLNLKVMGAIICFSLYFCICFVIILFLLFEVVACVAHMCMDVYMHVRAWVCTCTCTHGCVYGVLNSNPSIHWSDFTVHLSHNQHQIFKSMNFLYVHTCMHNVSGKDIFGKMSSCLHTVNFGAQGTTWPWRNWLSWPVCALSHL